MDKERLAKLAGVEPIKEDIDDLHTQAINFMDDMLDSLGKEEHYGRKGDVIRHILQCLQDNK